MNFHWKLLLSEIEVLQLTPLEHLRFRRNTQPSGLARANTCLKIKSTQLSAKSSIRVYVCSNLLWKKNKNAMDKEEEKNGRRSYEQRRRWREEDLVWGSLIRSRPGCPVHSGSLRWMTSLWRETVWEGGGCLSFAQLFFSSSLFRPLYEPSASL